MSRSFLLFREFFYFIPRKTFHGSLNSTGVRGPPLFVYPLYSRPILLHASSPINRIAIDSPPKTLPFFPQTIAANPFFFFACQFCEFLTLLVTNFSTLAFLGTFFLRAVQSFSSPPWEYFYYALFLLGDSE